MTSSRFHRLLALIAILSCIPPAFAQTDPPRAEAWVGYALLSLDDFRDRNIHHGVVGGFLWNVTPSFGVEISSSAVFGEDSFGGDLPGSSVSKGDSRAQMFLAGLRWTRRGRRTSGFVHGLAGVTRIDRDPLTSPGGSSTLPDTKTMSSFGFGGGVDVPLNKRFAIRAFQADYLRTRSGFGGGDGTRHNVVFQSGLVIKFGGR